MIKLPFIDIHLHLSGKIFWFNFNNCEVRWFTLGNTQCVLGLTDKSASQMLLFNLSILCMTTNYLLMNHLTHFSGRPILPVSM